MDYLPETEANQAHKWPKCTVLKTDWIAYFSAKVKEMDLKE
jgi:hypothetical protein